MCRIRGGRGTEQVTTGEVNPDHVSGQFHAHFRRRLRGTFVTFVGRFAGAFLGRCPSTVRPVFPVLVFQLSKQQNRTRTTSSTVLGTPPNRTRTKKSSLKDLRGRLLSSLGSQLGIHRNLGLSPLGTVPETVLRHLLTSFKGCKREKTTLLGTLVGALMGALVGSVRRRDSFLFARIRSRELIRKKPRIFKIRARFARTGPGPKKWSDLQVESQVYSHCLGVSDFLWRGPYNNYSKKSLHKVTRIDLRESSRYSRPWRE